MDVVRQLGESLAVQVVGDVTVVTGDGQGCAALFLGDQGREIEPDRPSLGSLGHRRGHLRGELHLGLVEDPYGGGRVEGQIRGGQLDGITACPAGAPDAAVRTGSPPPPGIPGDSRDDHAQDIVTGRRPDGVQVVEHQDEGLRARAKRRGQARGSATQRGDTEPVDVRDQIGEIRGDRRVRGSHDGQQRGGVVVEAVERHPGDSSSLRFGPLRQQGRLAVPRRCGDADDSAAARTDPGDQIGTAHRTCADGRHCQLRVEQQGIQHPDRCGSRAVPGVPPGQGLAGRVRHVWESRGARAPDALGVDLRSVPAVSAVVASVVAPPGAASDAVGHDRGGSHRRGRPCDGRWSDHCGTAHASSG